MTDIPIPDTGYVAKLFERTGIYGKANALEAIADAGLVPLTMPDLAVFRILVHDRASSLFCQGYHTASVKIDGHTSDGRDVRLYAHIPTVLNDPPYLRRMITEKQLMNGAAPVPQAEIDRLVALSPTTAHRVFIHDLPTAAAAASGSYLLRGLRELDQTASFLGDPRLVTPYVTPYLTTLASLYIRDTFSFWHTNDLATTNTSHGRVLYLGLDDIDGFHGGNFLDGNGRVLGVAPEAQRYLRDQIPRLASLIAELPTPVRTPAPETRAQPPSRTPAQKPLNTPEEQKALDDANALAKRLGRFGIIELD